MATTVTVGSNYAGKVAGEIIGAAFKEADTLAKGLVTPLFNVNDRISLRRLRYTDGTTAYSCGFAPQGAIVLNERQIVPVKLKNDLEVCKEDFRQTWSEDGFGASAHNDQFAPDIESAILAEVLASTAQRTDDLIWNGDSSNAGEWDGFTKLFAADASVVKPTPAGAITKDNVIAALELVENSIPTPMLRKSLVFIVSPDVATKYLQKLTSFGAINGLGGNANATLTFGRYELQIVNGLADNTIVAYEVKNLAFATGLLADHNEIRVKDMEDVLFDGRVRIKMVYNGGVNYYNSEDIVYYVGA
jgi:hypothetical protein